MKLPILTLCLTLFVIGCKPTENKESTPNKFSDPVLRKIYDLQDQRNAIGLIPFLGDENPKNRAAAALAFASVQDSASLNNLNQLLTDGNKDVRKAAAYAIGQTANIISLKALNDQLQKDTDVSVQNTILEAIGKCAEDSTTIDLIVSFNKGKKENNLGIAMGLYRAGLKRIYAPSGTDRIIEILDSDPNKEVRLMASNYLYRFRNLGFEPYEDKIANHLTKDKDPHVRMNCAMALTKTSDPKMLDLLIERFKAENNYLVKVNILRSLSNADISITKDFLVESLSDPNFHVAITAAQVLTRKSGISDVDKLRTIANSTGFWRVKTILLSHNIKFEGDAFEDIKKAYNKSDNVYEKRALLDAAANSEKAFDWLKSIYEKEANILIKENALQSIISLVDNKDLRNKIKVKEKDLVALYKNAIGITDAGLIFSASRALRNEENNFKKLIKDYSFLNVAKEKLKLPEDFESYVELQRTLDYFEGKEEETQLPEVKDEDLNWDDILKIKKNHISTIKTSKGDIKLEMFVEDAPGSVANFVNLANKKTYDNKTFHRVIANFVAQGGCPRGDGIGGMDYTIRSEFAPLNYREGYLGMASAGKDTESCQWFITHSPTPHLDGRYTIFGKVISGMDIVHQLEIGDKIITIE